MTKKDYVKLAAALRALPTYGAPDKPWAFQLDIIDTIADVLAADNASFDRDRFVAAATVPR